jgi:hypothetical protein
MSMYECNHLSQFLSNLPERDFVRWPRCDGGLIGGDGHAVIGQLLDDAVLKGY